MRNDLVGRPSKTRHVIPSKGGLPMYLVARGLYKFKHPKVFVPPCTKEDLEKLINIHRVFVQIELKLELVGYDIGPQGNI
ncbi:tRNase Z TRZ2, chloroplastic-like [Apium graveolens]|uniref:tRNase Z TRZ2, chloroplastic-like n=1 Tax=Apium graveolens TaxID=4045 RepID=UPI003D7BC054